jgi:hypothetical protein
MRGTRPLSALFLLFFFFPLCSARLFPGEQLISASRLSGGAKESKRGTSAPEHPSGILGRRFSLAMQRRDAAHKLTNSSVGVFQTGYGGWRHPTLLMAAAQMTSVDGTGRFGLGAAGTRVTFVGWNSPLTRKVDRWLIIEPPSAVTPGSVQDGPAKKGKGAVKSPEAQCWYYNDTDPAGFMDPFSQILDRFAYAGANASHDFFKYRFHPPGRPLQVASMTTGLGGSPPQFVTVDNSLHGSLVSSYAFNYSSVSKTLDRALFSWQKGFTCHRVANFTALSGVCMESLLVLEYGCV